MAKEQVCPNCGYRGRPKKMVKGSIVIELILWLLILIPGIIYSIWRHTTKYWVCPKCGAPNMVPLDSPRGKKTLEDLS